MVRCIVLGLGRVTDWHSLW